EVGTPEAVVPRRAERQRLLAEALLGRLVEVERGDLELRDVARDPRVAGEERAAALGPPELPERGLVEPGALEEVGQHASLARAVADRRALGVDEESEEIFPVAEPAAENDFIGREGAVTVRRGARRRQLPRKLLDADAHDGTLSEASDRRVRSAANRDCRFA